jgi:predicted ArsR family transcriptional regulator
MEIVKMTQSQRILKVLKSGQGYTAGQLAGMAGTTKASVRARVSELRADGFAVYANTRSSDGKTFYRLGTPTREMVAMAYSVMGGQAFGQ